MGISKLLLESMHEDYLEEMVYLAHLRWEWEQEMQEELRNEKGRVHIELPENIKDESHNQSEKLPF